MHVSESLKYKEVAKTNAKETNRLPALRGGSLKRRDFDVGTP